MDFSAPEPEPPGAVGDDMLRLFFTCCHPALSTQTQVALALRYLGGLSTAQVARALLTPEPTMAKRLTRAKQKITQARIPYRVPAASDLPARLAGVAATIYLVFNEGYVTRANASLTNLSLTAEAIRYELTDWNAIVSWYDVLLSLHDTRWRGSTGRRPSQNATDQRPHCRSST